MCRNCEDEAKYRREDPQPLAARLQGEPEEGTEHASEHRVAAKPKERVAAAELAGARFGSGEHRFSGVSSKPTLACALNQASNLWLDFDGRNFVGTGALKINVQV